MGEIGIYILIFLVILIIAIGRYISAIEEKRIQALQNSASKLKLNFSFDDKFNLWDSHSYHSLFQIPSRRFQASNIIYGSYKGKSMHCFDYYFYMQGGKGGSTNYCCCVLYDFDAKVCMKHLSIRPEELFDKLMDASGFEDIDFESNEFSRKFYVKSKDKKFAYDVIHTRMMEFFLRNKISYSFELREHSILLYKEGKLKPQEVEYMLNTMVGFINLMPEYLLQELKEGRV